MKISKLHLQSILLFVFCFLCYHISYGQISKIQSGIEKYRKANPVEKLYLQTDKPYYSVGDTLWYKAYLLNADFLDAATRSGLLYIELISDSGKIVKQQLIPVEAGISWGNIALSDIEFKEGVYTIRGYTNLMRNFAESYFFTKQIQIYHPVSGHWLVKDKSKLVKDTIISHLQLSRINGEPLVLREISLKLMNGNKNIYKGRADTKLDGTLDVNFAIPEKPEKLILQLTDLRPGEGNQRLDIPVALQRPEFTDLQFMPEGGNLVAGLSSRVAFKAIGEDGKAGEVSGKIYNSKQQQVAQFTSTHLGMGSFTMVPIAGESYIAILNDVAGNSKTFDLPKVRSIGTAISVTDVETGDSIRVKLMATKDVSGDNTFYLTGQSRNLMCYASVVRFTTNQVIVNVPKSAFPSGITRFTLLNQDCIPINERIVYINHHDNLNISITPSRLNYSNYDSIALNINVKDEMGKPVKGNFSLSVTDDGQVVQDTLNYIVTQMLLTSDLKGEVENPAYYFGGLPGAVKDLDNLLLTQGWIGYDWKDIFNSKPATTIYPAEAEYTIKGRVTNVLNKPVKNNGVSLLSKKPFLVKDTLTNTEGAFTFKNINPIDTALYFIQAKNRSGGSMNIGIEVDEHQPATFIPINHGLTPWYVNTDTVRASYANTDIIKNENLAKPYNKGIVLKQVNISAKKVIKGSHNLNGPGEADQVIDKEELEMVGKITLGNLLKQRVKGFQIGEFPIWVSPPLRRLKLSDPRRKQCYLIGEKQLRLVIDGFDVDYLYRELDYNSKIERFNFIKSYLDYYTAEDVKGIEVMYSKKYNTNYNNKILNDQELELLNIFSDVAYVEITTRSGHGPFIKATPGTFLYKPLAFSLPNQFYRPRYNAKPSNYNPDLRQTIHWEPNIISDTLGKASLSFYSAGTPGTYTIRVEGTDMNGEVGFKTMQITIKK